MEINIDLLAKDIAELIKKRVSENRSEPADIAKYPDAVKALTEIKEAVKQIRPDLETVIHIKKIPDKYNIEPLDQFYFLDRAELDSAKLRKKNKPE